MVIFILDVSVLFSKYYSTLILPEDLLQIWSTIINSMAQMLDDANKYKQKPNIRVESTVEISKILLREYQHLNLVLVIINDVEQLQLTAIINNSFRTRTKTEYD